MKGSAGHYIIREAMQHSLRNTFLVLDVVHRKSTLPIHCVSKHAQVRARKAATWQGSGQSHSQGLQGNSM